LSSTSVYSNDDDDDDDDIGLLERKTTENAWFTINAGKFTSSFDCGKADRRREAPFARTTMGLLRG
jgi:hypothetical protein